MSRKQATKLERANPDVAGALQAIRARKSPEQIKAERLLPFIPVIDEALALGWKWSPIVRLIRESGGSSLTKAEAEALYVQIKRQAGSMQDESVGQLADSTQNSVGGKEIE